MLETNRGGALLVTSTLSFLPFYSTKSNQKISTTNSAQAVTLPTKIQSTNIGASVGDPITSIDASILFNDSLLSGISIPVTTELVTGTTDEYNVTVVSGSNTPINADGRDLVMVDTFQLGTDTYHIVSIGQQAFDFTANQGITCKTLTFPSTLTSIANSAFYKCTMELDFTQCTKLTEIYDLAFSYCSGITNLVLPDGLKWIDASAFYGCAELSTVNFPNSIRSIETDAFGLTRITSITTPNQETTGTGMGTWTWGSRNVPFLTRAFYGSDGKIVGQIIEDSLTPYFSIGGLAYGHLIFSDSDSATALSTGSCIMHCLGVTSVTFGDNITSIGPDAFTYTGLTSLELPSSITNVGNYCFGQCKSLTSITILNSATELGSQVFSGCENIRKVDLSSFNPSTPPSWNFDPFCFGGNISNVEWLIPYTSNQSDLSAWTSAINNWFGQGEDPVNIGFDINDPSTYFSADYLSGSTNVILSDATSISSPLIISDGKNLEATNLSIRSDANVVGIFENAFTDNTYLTGSLTIPNTITSINANAFSGCTGLTSLSLADGLTTIGEGAFSNDTGLSGTLTIPTSVGDIGTNAFKNCSSVKDIDLSNFTSVPTNWQDGCFGGSSADFLIPPSTVPATRGEWYAAIDNWTNVTSPSVNFQDNAKNYAAGVTNGTFDLKVTDNVGTLSLLDGTDVVATDLVINDDSGITTINDGAFQNDKNLFGSIDIPTDITTIGANVFNGCSNVNEIRLNWTNLSSINALDINQDWLGDLNNSNTTILVPDGMVDAYQAVASTWGMDQCNITDGSVPPGPTPTPTDSTLNLGIALGVSLGICIGIPGIIGLGFLIDYKTKEKKQNKQE